MCQEYGIPPQASSPTPGDQEIAACRHCLVPVEAGQTSFVIPEFGEVHAWCVGYCACDTIWPRFVVADRYLLLQTCAGCARRAADLLAEEIRVPHPSEQTTEVFGWFE